MTNTVINNLIQSSTGDLILKINQNPYNGSCLVTSNKTGYSFETIFAIQCLDWIDADGFITSYEYLGNSL